MSIKHLLILMAKFIGVAIMSFICGLILASIFIAICIGIGISLCSGALISGGIIFLFLFLYTWMEKNTWNTERKKTDNGTLCDLIVHALSSGNSPEKILLHLESWGYSCDDLIVLVVELDKELTELKSKNKNI
jgi:hypothetical protein